MNIQRQLLKDTINFVCFCNGHASCPSPDDRVPGDKIDDGDDYDYDYDEDYHDSTNFKMWQGSLPHKKYCVFLKSSS